MAKGVKKIKCTERSGVLEEFSSSANNIICIKPNQMVPFEVSEWYDDTTAAEKANTITWLWQDQKKTTVFHKAVKQHNTPLGVNLTKKLCGSYAYYLEASLYGSHDHRNTGLHVYGKCEEKITTASWSKKENTADTSEINYGNNLFINLETEGVNGDTLTLELYSEKNTKSIQTIKAKCIDGKILKAQFFTLGYRLFVLGILENTEKFYLKVADITGKYLTTASGSDKILSISIVNKNAVPEFKTPTNNTPLKVGTPDKDPEEEEVKIEGIITAYFAKEEFTKETAEVDGQHEYKFANTNNNIDKNKIAGIIKKKVDTQVKANKKYAKIEDIKNALDKESYGVGDTVSFNLYKLGAEFKKINSAPLEEEVYVVAKTFLLDGKEVSITIKEKEAIIVDADADFQVTEAKENGAELTTLKATVENGIAKVKIKLRPKADEDLKKWKEKLANGKEDGTHKYTVKSPFKVSGDLDKIAGSIEKKSNEALAPNHIVKKEDISKLLTEGASYTTTDSFDLPKYKKEKTTENLWLKAECQGDTKKHEGEFLKKDGEYFVIGKKCECEEKVRAFMRMLRVKEGTQGDSGYEKVVGGKSFIKDYGKDWSTHPDISIYIERIGSSSDAAGAYQFMGTTYNEIKNKYSDRYNITDFGKESQDKYCLVIMKHGYTTDRYPEFYNTSSVTKNEWRKRFKNQQGDIIKFIIEDNFKRAVLLASLGWASLPDSPYGQQSSDYTHDDVKKIYDKYLEEELIEPSKELHLKKGFLKEFRYNCGCSNKGNEKWQNPLTNPQITIYTSGGLKRPWRSAFGSVRPDLGRPHHGLDLFAPIGTDLYSCLPGKVVYAENVNGYGKVIIIEIENISDFKNSKLGYSPYYIKSKRSYDSKEYDIDGFADFIEYEGIEESESVFLKYAHLDEFSVKVGDVISKEVYKTKVIGKTGDSGATGTKGPHLHFEISSVTWPNKNKEEGFAERYNPAKYVDYKNESALTTEERNIQNNNSK
jgi:murein DD-endopeptidase MepM/ murein hydrolase activator NlpD